jgi:hypothetical protein
LPVTNTLAYYEYFGERPKTIGFSGLYYKNILTIVSDDRK